jgi:hypothetical protein
MSNALAIAGVTAVLQYYLGNVYSGLSAIFGGTPTVSAKAPDMVQTEITANQSLNQINLFMHQVTHNPGWRNQDLPSMSSDGKSRLKNPPLALDLHYLLTAYGSQDWQAEGLLGYAVLLLHQSPVLTRQDIRTAMAALPLNDSTNPLSTALGAAGLADQIEMIKITPETLGKEEMAWLWTALKADYRPTFPFQVSVVLLEPQLTTSFARPVLTRNIAAQAGPPPLLFELQLPVGQQAPAQGDTVTVTGQSLTGASKIALSNARIGINYPPFAPTTVRDTSVTFKVPTDPTGLPPGGYDLSVLFTNSGGTAVLSTNTLPMGIAPTVSGSPIATNNTSGTLVALTCAPDVVPGQTVSLSLGSVTGGNSISASAQTFDSKTNSLRFQFPTLSAGQYLVVLSVDGVDSPIQVNWNATPFPKFTGPLLTI